MIALTTAANAVAGIIMLMPLIIFSALAFWKLHPVLFIILAGISLVTACYMPDIMTSGTTTNLSLTAALGIITYGLACIVFAFMTMFKGAR